jgi:hypothetical protein
MGAKDGNADQYTRRKQSNMRFQEIGEVQEPDQLGALGSKALPDDECLEVFRDEADTPKRKDNHPIRPATNYEREGKPSRKRWPESQHGDRRVRKRENCYSE